MLDAYSLLETVNMNGNLLDENVLAMNTPEQNLAILESAFMEIMNEAYFGRDQVSEIIQIMGQIRTKVLNDKRVDLYKEPESSKLNAAICKAFGFKRANVYWSDTEVGKGPFTLPKAKIMEADDLNLQQGSFTNSKTGFYDKSHRIVAMIQMDNNLFSYYDLTAEEATAVLIHEIGHNFDHSLYSVMESFMKTILGVTTMITNPNVINIVSTAINFTTMTDIGRDAYMVLHNLEDIVIKSLPRPISSVYHGVKWISASKNKIITMLVSATLGIVLLPSNIITMPIKYLSNFFTRKSETYADSFAAAYGLAPELATGLNKLENGTLTFKKTFGPLVVFDNMTMLMQEVMAFTSGGHGSTQQRIIRTMDSLRRDIEGSNLSPADKKAAQKELDRINKCYESVLNCNDDEKRVLVQVFRKAVDSYYRGKDFRLTPTEPQETYAN